MAFLAASSSTMVSKVRKEISARHMGHRNKGSSIDYQGAHEATHLLPVHGVIS